MFSLIVTIISIALVAGLALATLFYLGSVWKNQQASVNASVLTNQANQIYAASLLYSQDHGGTWTGEVSDLVAGDYLKALPVPPSQALKYAKQGSDGVSYAYAQTTVSWKIVLNSTGKLTHIVLQDAINYSTCAQVQLKAQNRDNIWSVTNTVQIGTQVRDDLIFQCVDSATPAGVAQGNPAGYTYYWLAPGIGSPCSNLTGINATLGLPATTLVCDPSTMQTGPATVTCPGGQHDNGAGICMCDSTNQIPDGFGFCPIGCPIGQQDTGSGTCTCNTNGLPPVAGYCAVSCPVGQQDTGSGTCNCVSTGTPPVAGYCPASCPADQHDNGASSCVCNSTSVPPIGGYCAVTCPTGQHDDGAGVCLCNGSNDTPVGGICATLDPYSGLMPTYVSFDTAVNNPIQNLAGGGSSTDLSLLRVTGAVGSGIQVNPISSTSMAWAPAGATPPGGDGTLEFWWKNPDINKAGTTIVAAPMDIRIGCDASTCSALAYISNSYALAGPSSWPKGTWAHIALVKSSGSLALYVNGTKGSGYSTMADIGYWVQVPAANGSGTGGYFDELKRIRGAKYTANFTPQVSPAYITMPMACPGGQHDQGNNLCICSAGSYAPTFEDCGITAHTSIFDDLDTYSSGNTNVGGASNPYITGAGKHGNGLYLEHTGEGGANRSRIYNAGAGTAVGFNNYTAELWYKPSAPFWPREPYVLRLAQSGTSTNNVLVQMGTCVEVGNCYILTPFSSTPVAVTYNEWMHIAVTREGGTTRFFVNGVLADTASGYMQQTGSMEKMQIGGASGIYDEIRLIANKALYTSNFTPPATAPSF